MSENENSNFDSSLIDEYKYLESMKSKFKDYKIDPNFFGETKFIDKKFEEKFKVFYYSNLFRKFKIVYDINFYIFQLLFFYLIIETNELLIRLIMMIFLSLSFFCTLISYLTKKTTIIYFADKIAVFLYFLNLFSQGIVIIFFRDKNPENPEDLSLGYFFVQLSLVGFFDQLKSPGNFFSSLFYNIISAIFIIYLHFSLKLVTGIYYLVFAYLGQLSVIGRKFMDYTLRTYFNNKVKMDKWYMYAYEMDQKFPGKKIQKITMRNDKVVKTEEIPGFLEGLREHLENCEKQREKWKWK